MSETPEKARCFDSESEHIAPLQGTHGAAKGLPGLPPGAAGRPQVFISARVHPGETNASWIMKVADSIAQQAALVRAVLRGHVVARVSIRPEAVRTADAVGLVVLPPI